MSRADFRKATHTVILSDIHLSDAEPPHPINPLWKRYKRPKLFVDRSFKRFLDHLAESVGPAQDGDSNSIELVLNGDIFDFDAVMAKPAKPAFHISWLEHRRGLAAEERKSVFKMQVILQDHAVWVEALHEFVMRGHRVVFVIGNHDMELHWPGVQQAVIEALNLPEGRRDSVRFCEWFYISNRDTLIEHGNQYDSYCLCSDPVHPLIRKGTHLYVRLPFGNLANKFMLNGMGLFNPHVPSGYLMSFAEYVVFFYKYIIRTQPLLIWTWFWGAMMTLVASIGEGLLPAIKDPLMTESRVQQIAARANAAPRTVRLLRQLHVHPAIYDPFKILRELWLDRALLFGAAVFASVQIFSLLNLFVTLSVWWALIPLLVFMPFFIFYARSVKSNVQEIMDSIMHSAPLSSRIAQVKRVIHGHTHNERHLWMEGVELINTGSWSPGYRDLECTQPFGRKCFAWIKPDPTSATPGARVAELLEWKDPGIERVAMG